MKRVYKIQQSGSGAATVADGVLSFRRCLGESLCPAVRTEHWVIAEACLAQGILSNGAFYNAFKQVFLSVKNQGNHCSETGLP